MTQIKPTTANDHLLYFAYGSNLNLDDLNCWCERRGQAGDFLDFQQIAWLPDHEVCFSLRSKTRQGGVLDIKKSLGQEVPGALFHVRGQHGWEILDLKEGAPNRYQRLVVTVNLADGTLASARTYQVNPLQRVGFVEPSNAYVDVVCGGLDAWGLGDQHIRSAASC